MKNRLVELAQSETVESKAEREKSAAIEKISANLQSKRLTEKDLLYLAAALLWDNVHTEKQMEAMKTLLTTYKDYSESLKRIEAINEDLVPLEVIRAAQSRAAKIRYERDKDGKQAAKRFVADCWKDWQKKPSLYSTQGDFADDMLSKVETREDGEPIISRDTITKKWIPEWTNEEKAEPKK